MNCSESQELAWKKKRGIGERKEAKREPLQLLPNSRSNFYTILLCQGKAACAFNLKEWTEVEMLKKEQVNEGERAPHQKQHHNLNERDRRRQKKNRQENKKAHGHEEMSKTFSRRRRLAIMQQRNMVSSLFHVVHDTLVLTAPPGTHKSRQLAYGVQVHLAGNVLQLCWAEHLCKNPHRKASNSINSGVKVECAEENSKKTHILALEGKSTVS